jgi:hypothetical protein
MGWVFNRAAAVFGFDPLAYSSLFLFLFDMVVGWLACLECWVVDTVYTMLLGIPLSSLQYRTPR